MGKRNRLSQWLKLILLQSSSMSVGGQAIIEGVMMRSPHSFAIAIRKKDGRILIKEKNWKSLWDKFSILKKPFLRGVLVLIESLWNGIEALTFSAEQASDEPVADDKKTKDNDTQTQKTDTAMSKTSIALTLVFSFLMGMALFVALPHFLAWLFTQIIDDSLTINSLSFHLADGIIKMGIFVGYIALISRLPDIKRVFEYHGAEHKSIYTYENNEELEVINAKKYSTLHPRCGTSFLLVVLLSSILIFTIIFPFVPEPTNIPLLNHVIFVLIKIPMMLPIAAAAYELNRFSSKHMKNFFIKAIMSPGLWMQNLTTREPDDSQLEIALAAINKTLWREKNPQSIDHQLHIYKNLHEVKTLLP